MIVESTGAAPMSACCPFCSGRVAVLRYEPDGMLYYVTCPRCHARGPSACSYAHGDDGAVQIAIDGWNRREGATHAEG